ncbi:Dpi8p KNAG_0C02650 [Huiozyma naganishii CBS 8797]|uniref:Uncharacterized protein n=1 Tax=Huiozyma naganishii (strain ATCC MYA-139 / BCRC 22969 / CBS 8797 / KCTC 17520 / NBRC 10181 / NCYC 3082 / Yp74L-3) TaxID=1071383 RepID=J7S5U4_HUIN7|nr:hypothetical protein KNAG_0C02650 [Kazachstania naganishii CBS 8797]CCK69376.1 hypothetical protein KNAG_0C02650 [Kazachstania naganishii CBS 8797]
MLSQITKLAAQRGSTVAQTLGKSSTTGAFKKAVGEVSSGNSFKSFKDYRENAKTYGPLSATLAGKRHLTDVHH